MNRSSLKQLVEDAYKDIDGHKISADGQSKLGYYFLGFEYGEALFDSFYPMLEKARPQSGEVFYDLGSGLGKKLLIASLGFPFKKAIGIEVIPDLHNAAKEIIFSRVQTYEDNVGGVIELENKDFLDRDISDGDVFYISIAPHMLHIYLSSTLLSNLEATKKGTRVITSNIIIPSPNFSVEVEQESTYLGGNGKMYLHKKIT